MKIEILNIATPLNAEAAAQAGASLKTLSGVQDVSFFDGDAPTRAELVAVLAKAGVQVKEEKPAHGGGCCGGCGS